MADEITMSARISYVKGSETLARQLTDLITVASTGYSDLTQSIATSSTSLDFGNVSTPGAYFVQNLDSTNYVEIGYDGTNWPIKLLPGAYMQAYNSSGTTPRGRANTAACIVNVIGVVQ